MWVGTVTGARGSDFEFRGEDWVLERLVSIGRRRIAPPRVTAGSLKIGEGTSFGEEVAWGARAWGVDGGLSFSVKAGGAGGTEMNRQAATPMATPALAAVAKAKSFEDMLISRQNGRLDSIGQAGS